MFFRMLAGCFLHERCQMNIEQMGLLVQWTYKVKCSRLFTNVNTQKPNTFHEFAPEFSQIRPDPVFKTNGLVERV